MIGLSGAQRQNPTGQSILPTANIDSSLIGAIGQFLDLAKLTAQSARSTAFSSPPVVDPQELIARFVSSLQAGFQHSSATLSDSLTLEPPILPDPLVSRFDSFAELSHRLDSNLCVAVVGYPKSGKTTAVAEYMRGHPHECLWLDAADSSDAQTKWCDLVFYRLARFLDLADGTIPLVQQGLIDRSRSRRLLIVIDDAHLLSNIDEIAPIVQAAAASQQRIRVVLVGVDHPAFLQRLRAAAYSDWRLPGMSEMQANKLFESQGQTLSDLQRRALKILAVRTDGHPGMLRLARERIFQIQTEHDLSRLLTDVVGGLGSGLEAFQANLIKQFQAAINSGEQELCRRLAIAFRSFSKRLAKALWSAGCIESEFSIAWNDCVLRIFESQSNCRYSLPELYRRGLQDMISDKDAAAWHDAAADELATPQSGRLDPLDASDCVVHRVLSGNISQALEDAARFLASASGRTARPVRDFLTRRFEFWLAQALIHPGVSQTAAVRYLSMVLPVYRESGNQEQADKSAFRLRSLLQSAESSIEPPAILLGWAVLLIHSSVRGDTPLAEMAAQELARQKGVEVLDRHFDWPTIAVVSAYLSAHESPLKYLARVVSSRALSAPRLWHPQMGYELWRAVAATIYFAAERDHSAESTCRILSTIADRAAKCGEKEVALVLKAAVSRIQIDQLRDFPAAVSTSHLLPPPNTIVDARLRAYRQQTLGNALRCAGDLVGAEAAYRDALADWPAALKSEKAESMAMIGICQGRQQQYPQAVGMFLGAVEIYAQERRSPTDLPRAQTLLEACMSAVHSNQLGKALRCLIRAHAVLSKGDPTRPEWVTLGQLAWHLVDCMTGNKTGPDAVVPGFTLGLRGPIAGAERMEPLAPTLLLGQACANHGLPNRGLQLILFVWRNVKLLERRIGAATFGLDAAISLARLDLATEFSIAEIEWHLNQSDEGAPAGFREFYLDKRVSQVIGLVLDIVGTEGWKDRVRDALKIAEAGDSSSPATALLALTLRGILLTAEPEQDAELHEAFRQSLGFGAKESARRICFFWIFRHAVGRPIAEVDFLVWIWRLTWLSYDDGAGDSAFLAGFLDQQCQLWERVSSVDEYSWARSLLEILSGSGLDATTKARRFQDRLAEHAIDVWGIDRAVVEVALQLSFAKRLESAARLRDLTEVAFGSLILSPVAPEFVTKLKGQVVTLRMALNKRNQPANNLSTDWGSTITTFETLISALESGDFEDGVHGALLHLAPVARFFVPASEANYYVWLRHSVQGIESMVESLERVTALVTGPRAAQLLDSTDVPDFLRVRLSVTYFAAKGFETATKMVHALLHWRAQQGMHKSVSEAAAHRTENQIDRAMELLETCVAQLYEAEATCRTTESSPNDLWWICIDRGNLQKLVGTFLLKAEAPESLARQWLDQSIQSYRAAIKAAREVTTGVQASLLMRAAIEGKTVATALHNDAVAAEFTSELDQLAADPANLAELQHREAAQTKDLLHTIDASTRQAEGSLRIGGERAIQSLTNFFMETMGLPANRRRHVEDDARKAWRTEIAQWDYCRHLQPLQNLLHVQSPEIAYTRPTMYTCSCRLLGYQTNIEQTDIDAVIDAMKRTYCETCDQQSPLKSDESDINPEASQ